MISQECGMIAMDTNIQYWCDKMQQLNREKQQISLYNNS